jgi:pSer/pThr/pTyr-binding forkhead associated (FHA) protein
MLGPAPTTFCLSPLDGASDISVGPIPLMIGRDPSCEVRLDSPMVSRHHCCVAVFAGVMLVRDLGSTNGTRVNGRCVTVGWLAPGDVLSLAHFRFRLLRRPTLTPKGASVGAHDDSKDSDNTSLTGRPEGNTSSTQNNRIPQ